METEMRVERWRKDTYRGKLLVLLEDPAHFPLFPPLISRGAPQRTLYIDIRQTNLFVLYRARVFVTFKLCFLLVFPEFLKSTRLLKINSIAEDSNFFSTTMRNSVSHTASHLRIF